MITIDFSLAIGLGMCACLCLVAYLWLKGLRQKEKDLSLDPRFIWFCTVCTYSYINTHEDVISTCPRCGSYNKKS